MIRGVIFDMDGLMFATEQVYTDCWYQAAAEMGLSRVVLARELSLEEIKYIFYWKKRKYGFYYISVPFIKITINR